VSHSYARVSRTDMRSMRAIGYDDATGELELGFYPLGITSLAAEAATIGQPTEVAA
jgi:hypothetical protein